jgi:diaminopimelate epimerase
MTRLPFRKLHGTANDFVYVDARAGLPADPGDLARRLCDRHRGIGADGLILLRDSTTAACRMEIFNADGSHAEMCGNGIRGFAKYVLDHGLATGTPLAVETDAGVKTVTVTRTDGLVTSVTVDMGAPEWDGRRIPVDADGLVVDHPLEVAGEGYRVTCVSMGNPHCVVFVDDVDALDVPRLGPAFERHPFFPRRVNTEFVRVHGPEHLEMRVWERGSGETLACGTGAGAAAVAAARTGRAGRHVAVRLRGGELTIEWTPADQVRLSGPAVEVFEGLVEV